MKQIYQLLGVKNFEQACRKAELIVADVFIHGRASKHTDEEIELANQIIHERDRLEHAEYISEKEAYAEDIHMYL